MFGYSQSNSLGINAGFGHSWIKNYSDIKFKPHGNFGLSYIHSTEKNFGFGADLKYSIEGGKSESGSLITTTDLDYIRVPLKVMYFFGKYGQRVRPKIAVGPSLGFLVSGETTVENVANNTSAVTQDKSYFNGFDIGITGAVGLNYRLVKNTWFTADVNYYNSFRDIREQNSGNTPRLSNNNIALNIGVNWGIGK
jgi:hypothetical protein